MSYDFATICIHGKGKGKVTTNTGSISMPIYQTATFSHPGVGESTGYDYSRLQNPTREELERVMADLENGIDALAFSTGMSATTVLMELFQPNDHIISTDNLYGGSVRLFNHINSKNGLSFTYVDTSNIQNIENAIKPNTKAIFIETPTNPIMNFTDIAGVGKLAKEKGLLLIVDNTFLTPYFLKPLDLGADIVIHSGTKYLGGHNDTLAGFLVTNREDLSEKLRFIYKTIGACLSPFDSWLILRGIKTLGIRMNAHEQNAVIIAEWLKKQRKVTKVYFIGDKEHSSKEIIDRQTSGYGGMISFRVNSKETATKILEKVKLIKYAESLGGVESLITYPMLQTHADVAEDVRKSLGVDETLLRLSVGIEAAIDLINDLSNALD